MNRHEQVAMTVMIAKALFTAVVVGAALLFVLLIAAGIGRVLT